MWNCILKGKVIGMITHLKLRLADAIYNFEWVKIT